MRNTTLLSGIAIALAITFSAVTPAQATLVPVVAAASNNATVQVPGPRTGANGKAGFNIEGSGVQSPATNSSFGVTDFSFASLNIGGTATNIVGATLQLTQFNAAFSNPGAVSIYLSTQTGVSIEPANTTLNYNGTNNGLASVDTDLGTLSLLGSGTFNTTGNVNSGQQDFYPLTFTGPALTALLNAVNNKTSLRLVVTPDTATTAATWAGFTNGTFAAPTIAFFAVVPEPASIVLIGMGGLVLAGRRLIRKQK